MYIDKDLCLTCGKEVKSKVWGGDCLPEHRVVHQIACNFCGLVCGAVCDDDYCGTVVMVCPSCMDKAREGKLEGRKKEE